MPGVREDGRYFKVLCSPKILDVPLKAASRGCGSALGWPLSTFLDLCSGCTDPRGRAQSLSDKCFGIRKSQAIH